MLLFSLPFHAIANSRLWSFSFPVTFCWQKLSEPVSSYRISPPEPRLHASFVASATVEPLIKREMLLFHTNAWLCKSFYSYSGDNGDLYAFTFTLNYVFRFYESSRFLALRINALFNDIWNVAMYNYMHMSVLAGQ